VIAIATVAKIVQAVIIVPATTTDGIRLDPASVTADVIANLGITRMMVTDTSVRVTRPTMETIMRALTSAGIDTTRRMNLQHPRSSYRRSLVH
jgi:2-methylisocitrate lyase-like PEP mutase family enzyme